MSIIQLVSVCLGILMMITGALVHEVGAAYFMSDLSIVPGSYLLMAHPIGAIGVGAVLIALTVTALPDRRWR